MGGHRAPSLLIAVNSLKGHPQKLSHLILGSMQPFPNFNEFRPFHGPTHLHMKVSGNTIETYATL